MLISTSGVSRLSPATIERERLERWMRSYAASPLRLLVAPSGSGKTTVLLRYIHQAATDIAYCTLPPACSVAEFHARIATALGAQDAPKSYEDLLALVSGSPARCMQLAVDDADNACADALNELHRLVEDLPGNVTLIFAARSREAMRTRWLVGRGVADLCDAHKLFFTPEEAHLLAQSHGLDVSDLDVRRLIEETDGWAIAVSHSIRRAAAENERLDRAFAQWRAESQSFVNDLVTASLRTATEDERKSFWGLYNGGESVERDRMRDFEIRGLFVLEDGGSYRLYRALRPMDAQTQAAPKPTFVAPMMVKLFRSFEAHIQNRSIPWVRRRDQEIVKYLLLKPNGSASREEIAATFWPNAERHLATQSVRTACSTIRKAIGEVVGPRCVDLYFRTTPELQIDLENVVSDVRRFNAHFADGEIALNAGDGGGAEMHMRAAYKLYRGRLLEFEGEKEWFTASARQLHDRYVFILECLAEIALERDDATAAHLYLSQARASAGERPSLTRLLERLSFTRSAALQPSC